MRRSVLMTACVPMIASSGCAVLDALILRPSANIRRTPADFGYEYREVTLPMGETQISIWHVPAPAPRKGILVVVPGNDANKGRYTIGLPIFVDEGWDVVLMDFAGYGASTGTPSLAGLIESTRTVFDYALAQDSTVVGLGVSLGTPVLARVAADYDLTAVVFDSSIVLWEEASLWTSQRGLYSPLFNLADLFVATTTPGDYDTKYWITQVAEPKFFLQSPEDTTTPYLGAWELYQAAPQPKHLWSTQGEHAAQLFLDPVLYRSVVNGWLDGVLQRDPILNEEFQRLYQAEFEQALEDLGLR